VLLLASKKEGQVGPFGTINLSRGKKVVVEGSRKVERGLFVDSLGKQPRNICGGPLSLACGWPGMCSISSSALHTEPKQ